MFGFSKHLCYRMLGFPLWFEPSLQKKGPCFRWGFQNINVLSFQINGFMCKEPFKFLFFKLGEFKASNSMRQDWGILQVERDPQRHECWTVIDNMINICFWLQQLNQANPFFSYFLKCWVKLALYLGFRDRFIWRRHLRKQWSSNSYSPENPDTSL